MASSSKKIAVIGSGSMVGSRFCELQKTHTLIKADLKGDISVDITDYQSIDKFFSSYNFDVVILFSAFTDVDSAEKQRNDHLGIAWKVNVEGINKVAEVCNAKEKKLLFISTDFVFDGESGPYDEETQRASHLDKISWYGITKIKGEELIEKIIKDHLIIRIAFPYRSKFEEKKDFARSIIAKYDQGNLYPMFNDQFFTPTFIDDVAPAVEILLNGNNTGIYHVASPEITTPYDFAKYLLIKFNRDIKNLKSSSIVEYQQNNIGTPRPIHGGLKSDKISSLGFNPTSWKKGIDELFKQTNGKLI